MATTTLYRPVGQPELDLIAASDWRRFPPRLDWQPIFYPVTNEPYACWRLPSSLLPGNEVKSGLLRSWANDGQPKEVDER